MTPNLLVLGYTTRRKRNSREGSGEEAVAMNLGFDAELATSVWSCCRTAGKHRLHRGQGVSAVHADEHQV